MDPSRKAETFFRSFGEVSNTIKSPETFLTKLKISMAISGIILFSFSVFFILEVINFVHFVSPLFWVPLILAATGVFGSNWIYIKRLSKRSVEISVTFQNLQESHETVIYPQGPLDYRPSQAVTGHFTKAA